MNASRLLRKAPFNRSTYLAIVALPDEASAFQAYRLLQHHGISPEHLAIVGKGYSSPESVGLLEPMHIAINKACSFAKISGFLGAAIGLVLFIFFKVGWQMSLSFSLIAIIPAVTLMAGFCGAVLGALFGFLGEGSTAGIYHHHLRQGHYLLMMEGPKKLVHMGQEVLKQYCLPKAI